MAERDHIGTVAGGAVRVFVGFHEDRRNADGNGGPGQHRGEFPLAAAGGALPARLLHRMGGVENDGTAGPGHNRQRPHIGHQGVVAETGTPLAQHNVLIAGAFHLGGDVGHVPGGQELAFLDVDGPAGFPGSNQQVRLAAEEGRNLQDIDDLFEGGALGGVVDVGQHRNAQAVPDLGEHRPGALQAEAAGAVDAGPVGLVERGLEDQPDIEALGQFFEFLGRVQGMVAAFHDARTGNQGQRQVVADFQVADGNVTGFAHEGILTDGAR